MEIWDAYYADGRLAGKKLIRGEKIPENLRHGVVEILVMHEDGSILVMQRDFNKPNNPGKFEASAGGSILQGESFEEGAKRELYEETGISVEKLEAMYTVVTQRSIHKGYLALVNVAKNSVELQEGETIAYEWMDKSQFKDFYQSEEFDQRAGQRLKGFIEDDFIIKPKES